jgi:hypothetical protein
MPGESSQASKGGAVKDKTGTNQEQPKGDLEVNPAAEADSRGGNRRSRPRPAAKRPAGTKSACGGISRARIRAVGQTFLSAEKS